MASEGRPYEAGNIHFVQADQEEKYEHTQRQNQLEVQRRLDPPDAGQFHDRPEKHTCRRVGDDGVQPQPAKNALGQFGNDDEHPDIQQRLVQFIRVTSGSEQIHDLLEREAIHGHLEVLRRYCLGGLIAGPSISRPCGTCRQFPLQSRTRRRIPGYRAARI